jgi:hypothetical protein
MREYETTLNGEAVTLAATFKASQEIAKKVADPLVIAREAAIEGMALRVGAFQHQPKFRFTTENVPLLLHIGLRAAGSKMTLEDVQEAVFADGFAKCRDDAENYLALIVGPRSEEIGEAEKGSDDAGE